jgi:hypothetical protein
MARHQRRFTEKVLKRRLKQGRGQGVLKDYLPWLTIRDVKSRGLRTRILGVTVPRIHHLMSKIELRLFQHMEFCKDVLDLREQFPLFPHDETLAIARELNVVHPRDPISKFPIVMTTDLLVTVLRGDTIAYEAWCVKPAEQLQDARVLEKLEIERQYWARRRVSWFVFTDQEFSRGYRENLLVFHPYLRPDALHPLDPAVIHRIFKFLIPHVYPGAILAHITTKIDDELALPPGTALHVARFFFAHRAWPLDWSVPFHPRRPLIFQLSQDTTYAPAR